MPPSVSGPGIFWVNSGVTTPDLLPYQDFVRWYEDIHIPDWMGAKEGTMPVGWRYQCEDSSLETPFLVVYKFTDLADLGSKELAGVPLKHPSLPEGGPINKFTRFKAIVGPHIETWKSATAPIERAPLLVSEAVYVTGDAADDFQQWYREEYMKEISQLKGWRRTSRFQNGRAGPPPSGDNSSENANPRWLALHEFEDGSLDDTGHISSLLSRYKHTADASKNAKEPDIALFRLMRVYGDGMTVWQDPNLDKIL